MLTYFIYTLGFHRAEAINTTKHETLNLMYVWILKQHIFLCIFFLIVNQKFDEQNSVFPNLKAENSEV